MVKFSGRAVAVMGVPLVALTTGLAAGCGVSSPAPHAAGAATHASSKAPVTAEAAAPTVPSLAAVPRQGSIEQALPGHTAQAGLIRTASFTAVPPSALSAYQRAAEVIDAADNSCRLSWTLLAALGQVESDHGSTTGTLINAVARRTTATAPVLGPVLNGRHGRVAVPDTDGGHLDGNPRWDRAVGPMQLLPATWAEVAVDADGDGERDPQDIDDAALGAAVYLCGADDDLATRAGKRSAVYRYNHSRPYVLFVVALSHQYTVSEQALIPTMALRSVATAGLGAGLAGDSDGSTSTTKPARPATLAAAPSKKPPVVAAPAVTGAASPAESATDSATGASGSPSPSPSPTPSCPPDSSSPTAGPSPTTDPTTGPTCPTPTPSSSSSPTSSATTSASATPTATVTP